MQIPFFVTLVFLCEGSLLLASQDKAGISLPIHEEAVRSEIAPEDLIERSYHSGRNFPLEERCFQLLALTKTAEHIHSARSDTLAKGWSNELFRRASDLPPSWNRAAFQKNALETLAVAEPLTALEMLRKVDAPTGEVAQLPEDLRAFAALTIFPRVWDFKGPSALSALRSHAREIGRSGEYPYQAMSQISGRLVKRGDIDDLRSIFQEALEFYDEGPHVRSADQDFISYLETNWTYLSATLQDEAVRTTVGHLTREEKADNSVTEVVRVVSEKGTVLFPSQRIELLYRILPKVRQLDPVWASDLEEKYSSLKQATAAGAVQYTSRMRVINSTDASSEQVTATVSHGLQEGVLGQLRKEAVANPSQAAGLLTSITDSGLQAEALASLAVGFRKNDAARSAELFSAAQKKADEMPMGTPKLTALTSLAEAAASMHDYPTVEIEIQKGFDLGEELVREDLDTHPGQTVYMSEGREELSRLSRLGAQVALRVTMVRIDRVSDEALRAYLLVAAAEGLPRQVTTEQSPK